MLTVSVPSIKLPLSFNISKNKVMVITKTGLVEHARAGSFKFLGSVVGIVEEKFSCRQRIGEFASA